MIKTLLPTLAVASIGVASAALVVPTGITAFHQGDSAAGDGSTLKAIDGSGMTKGDASDPSTWTVGSTAWQDDWQGFSQPAADTTWAVLDLGGATSNLNLMYLWNVQEGGALNRGVSDFNIWYSNSPTLAPPATSGNVTTYSFSSGGWTQLGGTENLPIGTQVGDTGASFDVSGASGAQFIGIEMLTNHGGTRTGFAEVAFTTAAVPEPSSMILLLAGGFGLLRRRR